MPAYRILVVEDDNDLRPELVELLEDLGHHVESVTNGVDAMGMINADPGKFHLVISDIRMPRMDGMTMLEKLSSTYPDLPVAIITGHGDLHTAIRAMRLSAFDFLSKPFGYSEIEALIDRLPDAQDGFVGSSPFVCGYHEEGSLCVYTHQNSVKAARDAIRARLGSVCRGLGVNLHSLILCVSEAVANAVIHGNMGIDSSIMDEDDGISRYHEAVEGAQLKQDVFNRQVHISYIVNNGGVRVTVKDEGFGFDYESALQADMSESLLAHGRGLVLIRELSSNVVFEDKGAKISMEFVAT